MEIVPEAGWENLFEKLRNRKGKALLLGATDSGKSTLIKYLIKRLIAVNTKVSLIDSDVGQSSLGLPGTISMKVFCNEKDMEDFRFEKMFFVGTTNPATKISYMIDLTKRAVNLYREKSDITLIDTTGLVSGEIGRLLKIEKIKAVAPEHIIAVQRLNELEHILELIDNLDIYRIRTSRMVKIRNHEERFNYRKRKFEGYFNKEGIGEFLLYKSEAKFFYNNRSFSPGDSEFEEGTLLGLNHNEDTIALGILIEIASDSVNFISPVRSLKNVNRVMFGDINIK